MTNDVIQFVIRPFAGEGDIPRLLRLRMETEAIDQSGAEISEEKLRAQLSLPGHDPHRDRRVAEIPASQDGLAGYSLTWLAPQQEIAEIHVIVHPDWRRKGLGGELLRRALEQARSLGAIRARCIASARQSAPGSFLRENGFTPCGAYTEMRAPADQRLPPIVLPYGYQVRNYAEVQDIAILTQLMNECYADLWGHHHATQQQMEEWLPEFNQESLFMVFSEKDRPVGISRVELSLERTARNGLPTGYIDSPGIYSPHRRLDLYRALLLTGMKWLQNQAQALIELESWGDRKAVLDMYGELGFSILRQFTTYEKELKES